MSHHDTKYADLKTNLSAIGKMVFVDFYYEFKDFSISEEELADLIHKNNPRSVSNQQRFRIPRARHIFEQNQQLDALKLIINSKRIPQESRDKAAYILHQEEHLELTNLDAIDERRFIVELNDQSLYSNELSFEYNNIPEESKKKVTGNLVRYVRSKRVANNALNLAKHKCEVNESHYLFKRKNCDIWYTEPHHLVPLSAADDFPGINLDREQNIVSLCSNCHNLLHYGAEAESILRLLFEKRKELLRLIGIDISFEQLMSYYK